MVAILTKYFSRIFYFFHTIWTILSIPQINYYMIILVTTFPQKKLSNLLIIPLLGRQFDIKVYVSHPNCNNKLILVLLFPNHEICQRFSCQIFLKKK